MEGGGSDRAESIGRRRAAGWAAAGLASLALAQPLFQQISSHPAFLAEHGAGPAQVLLLAFVLGALPAFLAAWAARRRGAVGRVLRSFCITLPVAALARRPFALLDLPVAVQVSVALAVGVACAVLFERRSGARTFFAALGLAVLAVPLLFLSARTVRPFWWPTSSDVEITDLGAAKLPVADLQVVIVVLDELPAAVLYGTADGSVDGDRYPAFAELARTSHEFRRAYSVAGRTDRAMPSILSGLYPEGATRGLILAEYPDNLFTLAGQALRLDVQQDSALVPRRRRASPDRASGVGPMLADLSLVYLHWLLPPHLRPGLPDLHGGWTDLWSRRNVQRNDTTGAVLEAAEHGHFRIFTDFVRDLRPADGPALHYAHPLLPHQPWALLPSIQVYNDPWTVPAGIGAILSGHFWGDHAWSVRQAYHRLMLQTAAVDRQLGHLLRRLEEPGFAGRTLLVVSADHGIAFRPGDEKRGGSFDLLASEVLWTPLFVRLPGQETGVVHGEYAESVDLVPTLLGAIGFDRGRVESLDLDGRDLLASPPPAQPEETLFERLYGVAPQELDRLEELARQAHARRQEIYGPDIPTQPPDLWWRVGPDDELRALLGRSADELPLRTEPAGVSIFERPRIYQRVDPDDAWVPSWFHAELRPRSGSSVRPRENESVAVVLHGVVAAVTEARREGGEIRVSALIPPGRFREGVNEVRLFAVREDGLHPLPPLDADRLLRQELADAEAVAGGSGPSMIEELEILPLGSVELMAEDDGVAIVSPAIRPKIQLRLRSSSRLRRMILQLDVTSEEIAALGARWQDPESLGFRRTRHAAADLLPGRQTVRIEVVRESEPAAASEPSLPPELAEPDSALPTDERADVWQLELGQRPGRYVLHSIEVFEVESP